MINLNSSILKQTHGDWVDFLVENVQGTVGLALFDVMPGGTGDQTDRWLQVRLRNGRVVDVDGRAAVGSFHSAQISLGRVELLEFIK